MAGEIDGSDGHETVPYAQQFPNIAGPVISLKHAQQERVGQTGVVDTAPELL